MKKLDNKGISLIELLIALAILSIFMVTVNYFISSASKSTKQTKKQIAVQQNAKEVYDKLYDTIMQSTSIRVVTNQQVTAPTNADTTLQSTNFNSNLTVGNDVEFVSNAAFKSIGFAKANYGSATNYMADYKVNGVGKPSIYRKDSFGNSRPKTEYVSQAEYEAAVEALNGTIVDYAVFDNGEYMVKGFSTGPITQNGVTKYYTIVYDQPNKKVYMNVSDSEADFSIVPANLIADNCKKFTIKAQTGEYNSLVLNMTFSDAGYSYTVGGTVNIRNSKVMD